MEKIIDMFAVNKVNLVQLAEDWGVEVYPRGGDRYAIYCPAHDDKHLGNCFITQNEERNCFHCFSCGAAGGPVHFVMYLENCDYRTAQRKIADRYGLFLNKKYRKKKESVGLSYEEYKELRLKNSYTRIPIGIDKKGNTIYRCEIYTLKNLAEDDPEAYKAIVTGKIKEAVLGFNSFLAYLRNEKIKGMDREWECICKERINYFLKLLKKVTA